MSVRKRIRQFFCPHCVQNEASRERRARTLLILERSGESLDRIIESFPEVRQRIANDRNLILGDHPEEDEE